MSKTAAFFTLLGMVYDKLPENYVNLMIVKDISLSPSRLILIKQGKTHDLDLLIKIVQVTLPEVEIPEEVLSEVVN